MHCFFFVWPEAVACKNYFWKPRKRLHALCKQSSISLAFRSVGFDFTHWTDNPMHVHLVQMFSWLNSWICLMCCCIRIFSNYHSHLHHRGTLNNQCLVDVWWNTYFHVNDVGSSNWNSHFKVDVSDTRIDSILISFFQLFSECGAVALNCLASCVRMSKWETDTDRY